VPYVISDKLFDLLSRWMRGEIEMDLEEAGEELAEDAQRGIEGLCYTDEDWVRVMEDIGRNDLTKAEWGWVWERLDEIRLENSFVKGAVKAWMTGVMERLIRETEQRRIRISSDEGEPAGQR
jgi:hypothetical protein